MNKEDLRSTRISDYQVQPLSVTFNVVIESEQIIDIQVKDVKPGISKDVLINILRRLL